MNSLQEHLKCGLLVFTSPTLPHSREASSSGILALVIARSRVLHGLGRAAHVPGSLVTQPAGVALVVFTALGTEHALTHKHQVSEPM